MELNVIEESERVHEALGIPAGRAIELSNMLYAVFYSMDFDTYNDVTLLYKKIVDKCNSLEEVVLSISTFSDILSEHGKLVKKSDY